MSENESKAPRPGVIRTVICVVWVLAVTAAFCVVYWPALLHYVRGAVDRFPLLRPIIELFDVGS